MCTLSKCSACQARVIYFECCCCYCRAADPSKLACQQLCSITMPGCHHNLIAPRNQHSSYLSGDMPCTQLVQLLMPLCGLSLQLPCNKAAVAALDPTLCTLKCCGLLGGCKHTCTGTCGQCTKVRLDPSAASGSASTARPTSGRAQEGILELFLQHINEPGGVRTGAYRLRTEWSRDPWAGDAAAVRQQGMWQRWQRFMQDRLLPELGRSHCAVLTTRVDGPEGATTNPPQQQQRGHQLVGKLGDVGLRPALHQQAL